MIKSFQLLSLLSIWMNEIESAPQFHNFGQSFSSSSFVGPNGHVVTNQVYTDTHGNRVINGVNYPVQNSQASRVAQQQPARAPVQSQPPRVAAPVATARPVAAPTARPAAAVARPQTTSTNKDSAGAYKPDKSGKYKGN